jgi:hypothetical protein
MFRLQVCEDHIFGVEVICLTLLAKLSACVAGEEPLSGTCCANKGPAALHVLRASLWGSLKKSRHQHSPSNSACSWWDSHI